MMQDSLKINIDHLTHDHVHIFNYLPQVVPSVWAEKDCLSLSVTVTALIRLHLPTTNFPPHSVINHEARPVTTGEFVCVEPREGGLLYIWNGIVLNGLLADEDEDEAAHTEAARCGINNLRMWLELTFPSYTPLPENVYDACLYALSLCLVLGDKGEHIVPHQSNWN